VTFVPRDGSAPLPVLVNGEPETMDEARASEILSADEFELRVELGCGSEKATYWTCDFSYVGALRSRGGRDALISVCYTGICQDQRRLSFLISLGMSDRTYTVDRHIMHIVGTSQICTSEGRRCTMYMSIFHLLMPPRWRSGSASVSYWDV
jgi:hypothetical protein